MSPSSSAPSVLLFGKKIPALVVGIGTVLCLCLCGTAALVSSLRGNALSSDVIIAPATSELVTEIPSPTVAVRSTAVRAVSPIALPSPPAPTATATQTRTTVPIQATAKPSSTNTPASKPIATAKPVPPKPAATARPGNCHASYPDVCIPPPPPDLNCKDIPYKRFRVLPPDPHQFDGNKDGIGCE